ncbi:small GTP-binding protein, variant [Coccidioides immitis RS]|uniref:Small GTP-binding protein, variant n=1 Tax=Coccidioides immitis (strain RS) TaxID=246410 RepID=A0A0D8JT60_COCIM|nr:small GTP-binding protein, variant [Coccidioides immitis RS]KJF60309.1 small GTP-binding protein, variant [Coccidioides immitis RS]
MPGFSLCGREKVIQRKLVLLGDGACGKTSLLNVFTRGFFPTVYEPTVFENYVHDIFVDGIQLELSLWDTAGQEEFDQNVQSKWISEIAENCPGAKIVLVALKCDLREELNEKDNTEDTPEPRNVVTYAQGLEVAKRIGALRYLECSAMRNRGVNEAFTEASRVAITVRPAKSDNGPKCVIQ